MYIYRYDFSTDDAVSSTSAGLAQLHHELYLQLSSTPSRAPPSACLAHLDHSCHGQPNLHHYKLNVSRTKKHNDVSYACSSPRDLHEVT
ncbi:hypothetical protein L195_g046391, partial [Trifolium pratense]